MATERSDYTVGLRALADVIDANPDLPLPHCPSGHNTVTIWFHRGDGPVIERMAAAARAFGVPTHAELDEHTYELSGQVGRVPFRLLAARDDVIERVVVSATDVHAPHSADTVTIKREVVEYRCPAGLLDHPTDPGQIGP